MHGSTVVLVSLLTSVATTAGTTYLIHRYDILAEPEPEPTTISAPPLVGLAEHDARANAEALKIALLVQGREPTSEVEPGRVARQSVPPGQPLGPDGTISVVIADALPQVPKAVGLPLEEARAVLEKAGYAVAVGEATSHPEIAAGVVVAQAPAPETGLAPGEEVTLRASSGPASVVAPKLSGLSLSAAKKKLAEQGLSPKVRWISRAETVTYVVLSQKPRTGEPVEPGGSVEIVLNR